MRSSAHRRCGRCASGTAASCSSCSARRSRWSRATSASRRSAASTRRCSRGWRRTSTRSCTAPGSPTSRPIRAAALAVNVRGARARGRRRRAHRRRAADPREHLLRGRAWSTATSRRRSRRASPQRHPLRRGGARSSRSTSVCAAIDAREGGPEAPRGPARPHRGRHPARRRRSAGPTSTPTSRASPSTSLGAARRPARCTLVRPVDRRVRARVPVPGWNEGLNTSGPIVWMCSGYAWKVPMRADNCFDVVPVDTVARGMTLAVADALTDRAAPVYQLALGRSQPLHLRPRARPDRAQGPQGLRPERGQRGWSARSSPTSTRPRSTTAPTAASCCRRRRRRPSWLPRHLPQVRPGAAPAGERARTTGASSTDQRAGARACGSTRPRCCSRRIEQLWKSYQPFIHDHDYRFSTRNVRERTERSPEASARASAGTSPLDWRRLLDGRRDPRPRQVVAAALRGKEVPDDEGFDLGGDPPRASRPRAAGGRPPSRAAPTRASLAGRGRGVKRSSSPAGPATSAPTSSTELLARPLTRGSPLLTRAPGPRRGGREALAGAPAPHGTRSASTTRSSRIDFVPGDLHAAGLGIAEGRPRSA